jgi:hypothetical protein
MTHTRSLSISWHQVTDNFELLHSLIPPLCRFSTRLCDFREYRICLWCCEFTNPWHLSLRWRVVGVVYSGSHADPCHLFGHSSGWSLEGLPVWLFDSWSSFRLSFVGAPGPTENVVVYGKLSMADAVC